MNVNEILTYPMERDSWAKTVLIGGLLVFFGFLLVPLFAVYGYLVETIRASTAGDPNPPAFEDWETLLVDGAQAWVITVVFLVVPLLVAAVTVGGSVLAIATGSEAGAAVGVGGLFAGLTLSALLTLAFGYLAIVGIVNFAREGRFAAGFDAGVIKTVALDREYAIAWLASVAVVVVVGFVGMIPLVGWLLAPFAGFYGAVVAANLWAGGFAAAMDSTASLSRPGEGSGEDTTV